MSSLLLPTWELEHPDSQVPQFTGDYTAIDCKFGRCEKCNYQGYMLVKNRTYSKSQYSFSNKPHGTSAPDKNFNQ